VNLKRKLGVAKGEVEVCLGFIGWTLGRGWGFSGGQGGGGCGVVKRGQCRRGLLQNRNRCIEMGGEMAVGVHA